MIWNESRIWLKFEKSCLKEDKEPFTSKKEVKLFVPYELDTWSRDLNTDFTLKDCSFRAVKLSNNVNWDKYIYTGSGIGFDSRSEFSLPDNSMSKNVDIFDNKKKDISILCKGPA